MGLALCRCVIDDEIHQNYIVLNNCKIAINFVFPGSLLIVFLLIQPDFYMAISCIFVIFILLIAQPITRNKGCLFFCVIWLLFIVWLIIFPDYSVDKWLSVYWYPERDPIGASFNNVNVKRLIEEGGLWGKGAEFAEFPKLFYSANNYTLAFVGEAYGRFVMLGLLQVYFSLFALLLMRLYRSDQNAGEKILGVSLGILLLSNPLLNLLFFFPRAPKFEMALPLISVDSGLTIATFL